MGAALAGGPGRSGCGGRVRGWRRCCLNDVCLGPGLPPSAVLSWIGGGSRSAISSVFVGHFWADPWESCMGVAPLVLFSGTGWDLSARLPWGCPVLWLCKPCGLSLHLSPGPYAWLGVLRIGTRLTRARKCRCVACCPFPFGFVCLCGSCEEISPALNHFVLFSPAWRWTKELCVVHAQATQLSAV